MTSSKSAAFLALIGCLPTAPAQSTIDPDAAFAWGGNLGEFNWRPSEAKGALTGEYVCSGLIWSANAGWINLGDGSPANGIRYQNVDGADCGVNLLADGSLRGLAWGANIGWVNFEAAGNPRISLTTGILSGYAWSPNAGWISLDDGNDHFVGVKGIAAGADSDADTITDAWELERVGELATLTFNGDVDGDGVLDQDEYKADTDPFASTDAFEIRAVALSGDALSVSLTWPGRTTRHYFVETSADLSPGSWTRGAELVPGEDALTTYTFSLPPAKRIFFRLAYTRPLGR